MITKNINPVLSKEIACMAILDERIKENPGDVDALLKKAVLLFDSYLLFDEAIEILRSLIARDPDNVDALLWLGECFCFCIGDIVESEQVMRKALGIDQNRADCHMVLAASLDRSERNCPEAEFHYRRATELEPSWILPRKYLALILVCHGKLEQARQELEKALLNVPETIDVDEVYDPIKEYHASFMTGRRDPKARQLILEFMQEIDVKIAKRDKKTA